ncbi:MAG: hypothetical protein ACK5Y2_10990 [Bdellovibrionales bacterium]
MKWILWALVFPAIVSAQDFTNPSKGHLLDQTVAPEKSLGSPTRKPDYVETCRQAANKVSGSQPHRDQAIRDCLADLHDKQKKRIGHKACWALMNEIQSQDLRTEVEQSCLDRYGYDRCRSQKKNKPLSCLRKHASSLTPQKCQAELEKAGLTKNKEAQDLCKNGSEIRKGWGDPNIPLPPRDSGSRQ